MRRTLQTVSLIVCLSLVTNVPRGLVLAIVVVSLAAARMSYAQQPERFDVVSIKPNTAGTAASSLRPEPTGLVGVNVNVRRLLRVAYQVADFQIVDLPAWFDSEHFDIQARGGQTVSIEQLQQMIRAMLADRFGLQLRSERREMAGYALRVERPGTAGLRRALRPCAVAQTAQPRSAAALPPCFEAISGDLHARGVLMEMVAQQLQRYVGQPIVDETGLADYFDFDLRWRPDVVVKETPGTDAELPSIFTALREQLGLRLAAARPTVDVLVVTAARRPDPN